MSDHDFKDVDEVIEYLGDSEDSEVRSACGLSFEITEDAPVNSIIAEALAGMAEQDKSTEGNIETLPPGHYEVHAVLKIRRINSAPFHKGDGGYKN